MKSKFYKILKIKVIKSNIKNIVIIKNFRIFTKIRKWSRREELNFDWK